MCQSTLIRLPHGENAKHTYNEHTNNVEFYRTRISNTMHRIQVMSDTNCRVLIMFKNFQQIHAD